MSRTYAKRLTPLFVAFAVLSATRLAAQAEEPGGQPAWVLFADDFENGLSADWRRTLQVTVIVEGSNHFARLAADGATLNAPPALINVPGSYAPAELDAWSDYELSFRLRVGNPNAPAGQSASGSILQVAWNVSPVADAPYECRQFSLANWLPQQTWLGSGPAIPWYGKTEPFEDVSVKKGLFQFSAPRPPVTADWQAVRIRQQGDRSQVFFNDERIFDGSDLRAPSGGFMLRASWKQDVYDPRYIDIDDVKAVRLVAVTRASE